MPSRRGWHATRRGNFSILNFKPIAAGAVCEGKALAKHLLERTLPEGAMRLGEYYAATPGLDHALKDGLGSIPVVRPDLAPDVAAAFGLRPGEVIGERELQLLISGRRADGAELRQHVGKYEGKADGQKDRFSIAGYDVVFSAPKSVSVAWAFAKDEAEKATILQAHRDARDAALAYLESIIGYGRRGDGGSKGTEPGKIGWVSVDHFTARPTISIRRPDPETGVMGTEIYTLDPNTPGDPHLHTHNIIPNAVVTESGRVVSIHRELFIRRIHEIGGVYQAYLAENLRRAGIAVDLCERTHMAAVPIIPQTVCDEFSKRTADAEAAAREAAARRGKDWDAMDAEAKVRFLKGGAKASRRAKSDDLANFKDWFNQAAGMGWEHETAVTGETARKAAEDRIWAAYDTALPLLESELTRNAVLHGTDVRLQAVRGLIKHGIDTTDDISAVTRKMVAEGVKQDGKRTALLWSDGEDARVKVTTALHRDQEAELIRLAREAAEEKTLAVEGNLLAFDDRANDEQRAAASAMAEGGQFGVFIGVAGSGKTGFVLPPLVKAYMQRGCTVWGIAQAWRQAEALAEAGIPRFNTRALQPFLLGVADGRTKVDANSVVILDEVSQVGSRQMLELLRLRERYGFKIVATGDPRQCASIEAGPVIELLRLALGEDAVPQILTTNRQKSQREKEIAGLFREGTAAAAARAIDMKLEDETALAVDGGYQDVIERIADLAIEHDATVCAPTNHDALEIGRAMRRRRQALGTVGPDLSTIQCTDGRGGAFTLTLAVGDRVRLFARTMAVFESKGRRRASILGNNGSVLTVVAVTPEGLALQGDSGKEGFVSWDALRDPGTGRIKLGFGYCLTIDTAQGISSDNHVLALPRGSKAVDGLKGYVGNSRHRMRSWLVTSRAEEAAQVQAGRPLGVSTVVDDRDVWTNVANNFAKTSLKESATSFLEAANREKKNSINSFQTFNRIVERRRRAGLPSTSIKERVHNTEIITALHQISENVVAFKRPLISEFEAQQQFADAIFKAGLDLKGQLPIMNGDRHYVPLINAKPGKKQGMYQGHSDGWPAGFIVNYLANIEQRWKALAESEPISPAEAERIAGQAKQRLAERQRQKIEADTKSALLARRMISDAFPALPNHPYIRRKRIRPDGILQDRHNRLLIPLRDAAGEIWNVQRIYPGGFKAYLPGRKQGLWHMLGRAMDGEPLALVEGVATGATVGEATGWPVAVAMDSGNLLPVGRELRRLYPRSLIVIAGDNDHHLPRRIPPLPNVGLEKATEAAIAIDGLLFVPQFEPDDRSSDYNDLANTAGIDAVRASLGALLPATRSKRPIGELRPI